MPNLTTVSFGDRWESLPCPRRTCLFLLVASFEHQQSSDMTPPQSRKRGSSVSFARPKEDGEETGDEIQISLAPYVQPYLAGGSQGTGCCGIGLPIPFERAAPGSWWNPRFDSEILEGQFRRSAFPQIRLRFRYALAYILLVSLSWLFYFVVTGIGNDSPYWQMVTGVYGVVSATTFAVLYMTYTDHYRSYWLPTSLFVALLACLLSLMFVALIPSRSDGLTPVGHFALCMEILLLIYTVIPMPLYASVGICSVYSILFEFLTAYLRKNDHSAFSNRTSRGAHSTALPGLTDIAGTLAGDLGESRGSENFSLATTVENFSLATPDILPKIDLDSGSIALDFGAKSIDLPTPMSALTYPANVPKFTPPIFGNFMNVSDSMTGNTMLSSNWSAFSNLINSTGSSLGDVFGKNDVSSRLDFTAHTTAGDGQNIDDASDLIIRILMQICVHLIGLHILIMTYVRMRGTFMKVGQSLLVRRQLEMERQLKEKMIHSVMPPKVACWLMEGSEREREREDSLKKGSIPSNNADINSLFRPFNMHSMEDVSILFADIVGFTRMSSNKTAEELVGILNDLFERFDDLCAHHGCEKISTLGDCYYCVSGCPEPKPDHAGCCVEMGLAMIEAIKQFDVERHEGVNMRVGVHTGTVLCGIVGMKRFKFDVWSNDVTLANKLESTGIPGRVHISEKTLNFLENRYLTEDGETLNGTKTYFIRGRKTDLASQFSTGVTAARNNFPGPARHRLASCNQTKARPHYLHMVTNPTSYRAKANSLPSILDSDNETGDEKEDTNRSPTSIASYGKKKTKSKPWRYLQRQRTNEEMIPLDTDEIRRNVIVEKSEPRSVTTTSATAINAATSTTIDVERNDAYDQVPRDNGIETDPMPTQATYPLLAGREASSQATSVCSRKDSGIRSTSRRSSIQQQLFLMNGMGQADLLGHRVSGYYTSSQSTLNSGQDASSSVPPYPFPPAVTDTFGACFHKLRKQSDLQLIRCVQDNVSTQRSYCVDSPLSSVTLFFKNKEMERDYRQTAHKTNEGVGDNPPTLATSRFNTYLDILISALVFSAVTISLFLLYRPTAYYILFASIATTTQLCAVYLCVRQLARPKMKRATFASKIFKFFSRWHPWHACGAVLVSLPVISILINFSRDAIRETPNHLEYRYSYLLFVGLVHFCNFTQLNCWMKNLLVTLTGILFIILVASHVPWRGDQQRRADATVFEHWLPRGTSVVDGGRRDFIDGNEKARNAAEPRDQGSSKNSRIVVKRVSKNLIERKVPRSGTDDGASLLRETELSVDVLGTYGATNPPANSTETSNPSLPFDTGDTAAVRTSPDVDRSGRLYTSEIYLDMILLLLLVWYLNREFEISYRLSFHGNAVAARDKAKVQSMKNQADWLLHNIIPKYVADQLKTTAKYSQNHKSVGIIFASIVNFNELYDESYLGGKEYLRVLNELIGDFDELLEKPEFANVEKIKTIGSTFMAASGLNPQVRRRNEHEFEHLFQLLDFAVAMHKVIRDFNRDLLGFQLILRIGYNYGDVTAGVIGSTKLYYDIWGDAVNIASRMDSTGVAGRIQLASNCLEVLSERYAFEPRGQVYVKGKDNMDVFLLIGDRGSDDRAPRGS